MAMAGGSATANGILYQILGTLGRAVEISMRGQVVNDEIKTATLVVEPPRGGDLQIISGAGRIVEQWKSRAAGTTWSLADVIDDVLPDLYGAVEDEVERYRFVTEGRIGTWGPAYAFFQKLGPVPQGPDVLGQLDDVCQHKFARQEVLSERRLFLRVVEAVRRPRNAGDERIEDTYRKVWRLLSRFEVETQLKLDELIRQINISLRAVVEHVDDVDSKRLELCARVLALAAKGDVHFSPEELFSEAQLNLKSFLNWKDLRETLRRRLKRRLDQIGFNPQDDVRLGELGRFDKPIGFITGDSGQGKTWSSASLAWKAAAGPSLVVWVPAERGTRRVDEIVVEEIWHEGLGKDGTLTLASLARRRAEINPRSPMPWAHIYVDGVESRHEAAHLVSLDWEGWGLQLVLAGPPEVGRYVKSICPERIETVEVSDFTPLELRDYLAKRGRDWAKTPFDVRDLIRRPILARLFADVSQAPAWAPRHEYELMEAYWRRVRGHKSGQPHDYALLRALATRMLDEKPVYPWPPEVLLQLGVAPDAVQRLKECGWLREVDGGAVEMWHDRLLCWAVAEALANKRSTNALTTESLIGILRSLHERTDRWATRLAYVPLDTIWLISGPVQSTDAAREVSQVLAAIESYGGRGFETEWLYSKSLPTLGTRIIPCIVERVARAEDDEFSPYPKLAATTLFAIGRQEPAPVRQQIAVCLYSAKVNLQELGLRLLPHFPDSKHLGRAWELHRSMTLLDSKALAENSARFDRSFRAVSACLQERPEWALEQISAADSESPYLPEITRLLASAHGPVASKVWRAVKGRLFGCIPEQKRRCLIDAILRFRDTEEVGRLVEWSSSERDFVGPCSLSTLALFDPNRAVTTIEAAPVQLLWIARGSLSDTLMALVPDRLCGEVLRLASKRPDRVDEYLQLAAAGDRLDSATADAILSRFEQKMQDYLLNTNDEQVQLRVQRPLEWLAGLRGHAMLDALRRNRALPLELHLSQAACQWADNSSRCVDGRFEAATSVLLRIGGEGFTRVVNALLSAKSRYSQLKGCEWAPVRPDSETLRLVSDLAHSEQLWEDGGNPYPVLQHEAVNALAAMGEGSAVVSAVVRWDTKVTRDVAKLRENQKPLSDEELRPALERIDDNHADRRAEAVLAIGLSGRHDLRPRVMQLFLTSSFDSPVALCAMLALERLGGRDSELDERLIKQYASGHHKLMALRLLATGSEDESAMLLRTALPQSPPYDDMDRRIIAYLGSRDETRKFVQSHVRELAKTPHSLFLTGIELSQLLDPHDPEDAKQLWDSASGLGQELWSQGSRAAAIRRLARTQPGPAFELAYQALSGDENGHVEMPGILLSTDPERAIPLLVEFAINADKRRFCRTIALELRSHSERAVAELRRWIHDGRWQQRRAAACMAGYLGPGSLDDSLRQLVFSDEQVEVCLGAVSALRRQQREADATTLVECFAKAQSSDAWAVGDEIIHLVDPRILSDPDDRISFMTAMRAKPYVLRRYLLKGLKNREENIEKGLGSMFGEWVDDA